MKEPKITFFSEGHLKTLYKEGRRDKPRSVKKEKLGSHKEERGRQERHSYYKRTNTPSDKTFSWAEGLPIKTEEDFNHEFKRKRSDWF